MNWRKRKKLMKRQLWKVPRTKRPNGSDKSLRMFLRVNPDWKFS